MSNHSEKNTKTVKTIQENLSKKFNIDIKMYDFCKLSILALNNYVDKIKDISIIFEEDIIYNFYIWNIENRINYFYELYSSRNDIVKINQLKSKIYKYFENIIYINEIKNEILDKKKNIAKSDDNSVHNKDENNYLDFKKLFENVKSENDFTMFNILINNILIKDQKKSNYHVLYEKFNFR